MEVLQVTHTNLRQKLGHS